MKKEIENKEIKKTNKREPKVRIKKEDLNERKSSKDVEKKQELKGKKNIESKRENNTEQNREQKKDYKVESKRDYKTDSKRGQNRDNNIDSKRVQNRDSKTDSKRVQNRDNKNESNRDFKRDSGRELNRDNNFESRRDYKIDSKRDQRGRNRRDYRNENRVETIDANFEESVEEIKAEPVKLFKFEEFNLSNQLKRSIADSGYETATEIQSKSIPVILEGKDMIGQSKTGTGKTASYGLPLIEKIDEDSGDVQAIILCPTRELAIQVTDELRKFTKYLEGVKCLAIYGGQDIEQQIRMLKKGVQIVIGTPGRVMDHMRRKTLKLNNVKTVVLDEADEMLNMGFEEDIEIILKEVPEERQTILFSATMNKKIMGITKKYLKEPVNIAIKAEQLTVNTIEQIGINIKEGMKDEATMRLIEVYNPRKAIIFCNTKRKVDNLIEILKRNRYKAEALHGDIKQAQRDRIMKNLKAGGIQILVATDVAARGIDVQELDLVINYDIPQDDEYYVHRIGRTGRNGTCGVAYTYIVGREKRRIGEIERYAKIKIKEGSIPTVADVAIVRNKKIVNEIQEVINNNVFCNEEIIEELIKNGNSIDLIAKALLTKSYKTDDSSQEEIKNFNVNNGEMVNLFFNVGKKDDIRAKDIVGSITANTAVSGNAIGKINIMDSFSFVEIPAEFVQELIISMKNKQIKGREFNIEIAKR